jgi:hypothetical protein
MVKRAAREELQILLYHNPIIKYHSETDHTGIRTEFVTLDDCGKPTLTTARAMNRGLEQLSFPGRVRLDNGRLVYSNDRGVRMPLLTPLTLERDGGVQLFHYLDVFKDIEVTLLDEDGAEVPETEAALV